MSRRTRRWRPVPRPRPGRRLPRPLRASRVGALARRLPRGLRDPGFEILLRRIDASPLHRANRIETFIDGGAAFAAMTEAIAAGRSEVLVESYILRDDAAGRGLLESLAAAAGRGAAVRVLADALGSAETRSTFWRQMESRGIETRLFHPLFPQLWYQLFRDHRKILVVDRRTAFTGGMNIAEEYGSFRPSGKGSWRDTHVRVEGPAAWEMAVVFSEGWARAGGSPLAIPPLPAAAARDGGAGVLVLDSRPNRGHAESAAVLAAIVGAARGSVWITNAYFAPGHTAIRILSRAVERGVDVRLLLPGRTDVPLLRHAGHGWFSRLLASGVRIYEYEHAVLHAKSLVVDGFVSVVGSTNLDFRSFHFNAECNLVILDEATGGGLEDAFRRDLQTSREIHGDEWRQRSLPHRLGDRLARWLSPLL